ncbi:phenylacetate--CoA ligase family protein [Cohaesibacter gelatinilyticus]|uniref:Phenylacetate-CoA ligase n=1 Tax=Cohaesibacter gelatinilyticus TaxID=372072 RepID=A0A285PEX5_9HYPH|nr:AMP-binding protein [Cohaesibacter gelatinilyticus]SNZ19998.1 phenylacetate-CoA ligase [Cohaesibacter gelatinilyticus]
MSLLKNAEWADKATLASHQQTLWEKQSTYVAERSVFYQKLWQGTRPPQTLSDLAALPLSDKSQLRLSQAKHGPFGSYLAADPSEVNRLHRTSGTTGQAMNLALSARDCHITAVVGGRSHRAAGLKASDKVVHCLNYQMWMGGVSDHLTLEQTGAMVVPFGVGSSELLIRTIQEIGINAISCTPSYPSVLERVLESHFPNIDPKDLGLRLGLFGGEAGLDDPAFRQRLKDVWGMEPRNANYGVSDVFSNFASQCEHDTHLHFLGSDILYPELIDPDNGQVLDMQDGQIGELVLTHLAKDCQPLVRFRTGDILQIVASDPCSCGRTGMRFKVIGRSDDMVVVRGLNVFPTQIAAILGSMPQLSGDYRIILDGHPPYDRLPVHAEVAKQQGISDALAREVEALIKKRLGVTAEVTLRLFASFPTTEGKTRRVLHSAKDGVGHV